MCGNTHTTNIGDDFRVYLKVLRSYLGWNNNVGATGISGLADAVSIGKVELMELDTFCKLSLDMNPLGLEGAVAVGRMLMGSHCHA